MHRIMPPSFHVSHRVFLFWALAIVLTGLIGCGGPQTHGDGNAKQTEGQGEEASSQSASDVKLTGPAPLSILPRLSPFVLVVPDIQLAVDELGRKDLTTNYPEIYDLMVAGLVDMYGRDIVDPNQLADAGIDTSGAFATGWLDLEGNVGFMAAEVEDLDKVTGTIAQTARNMNGEVETETLDGATIQRILRPDGQRAWWVLRDDLVLVILTWKEDDVAWDYARMVARLAPRDSLAAAPFLDETLQGLPDSPSDVIATIWANPGQAAQHLLQEQSGSPSGDNYAREQLAEARRKGNPDDVQYWEGVLREQREWEERRQASERAGMSLLREAISPIRGVAFDVSVVQRELHLAGFVHTGEDNLAATLLENSSELAPVARLQQESPALLLHINSNRDSLIRIVDLMMQISGAATDEVSQAVKESTGLNLEEEILSTLNGEIGFAVWLDAKRLSSMGMGPDPSVVSSFTVTLGHNDAAGLQSALEAVFEETLLAALARRDGEAPRWTLIVPGYKSIFVSLDQEQLIVTTSETASKEIAAGTPAPWLQTMNGPEFSSWASTNESVGLGVMDWLLFSWTFLAFSDMHFATSAYAAYPDVPLSDASKALQDQLEAEEAKLEAMRTKQRSRSTEATLQIVDIIGRYAAEGKRVDNGYHVHFGFILGAESLPDTIGKAGQAILDMEKLQDQHRKDRQKLQTSIDNLQQQFMQQREQDASQHHP